MTKEVDVLVYHGQPLAKCRSHSLLAAKLYISANYGQYTTYVQSLQPDFNWFTHLPM